MVAGNLFNVRKFGATGNRNEKATGALRNAVDACAAAGGGMVYIPPGDYTVGTIQLKDNVTLHIEAGATLFLSQDREDFIPGARTMIFAEHVKNISVTGKGTLDGLAQLEKGVNADGIDICSSRNVTVSDSVIITADDSIVLKTPLREGQEKAVIA
jgi:polygalacturonase